MEATGGLPWSGRAVLQVIFSSQEGVHSLCCACCTGSGRSHSSASTNLTPGNDSLQKKPCHPSRALLNVWALNAAATNMNPLAQVATRPTAYNRQSTQNGPCVIISSGPDSKPTQGPLCTSSSFPSFHVYLQLQFHTNLLKRHTWALSLFVKPTEYFIACHYFSCGLETRKRLDILQNPWSQDCYYITAAQLLHRYS